MFVQASYNRSYFGFGATTISAFWEMREPLNGAGGGVSPNGSYVFAGDANGDGGSGNDLIYIPKNTSEMNFVAFTAGPNTFSPEQQAAAFEAYINQDKYLSKHRGEYAKRGEVWYPLVEEDGPEHYPGRLPQHRRSAQCRPVPHRHHELRQPAEPQLGREPALHWFQSRRPTARRF